MPLPRTRWTPFPAVIALCVGLMTAAAVAQDRTPGRTQPARPARTPTSDEIIGGAPPPTAAPAPEEPPAPKFSVEFAGGSVKQYVDAVKRAAGSDRVNVILPKDAEDVPIPALSLKDVTAATALEALRYAVGDDSAHQFSVVRISHGDGGDTLAVQHATRRRNLVEMTPGQPMEPVQRPSTRVFSIADLVEPASGSDQPAMTTETVLSALRALSELDARTKTQPPELMLHADSKILIARGSQDQLSSIESVLVQLHNSVGAKRSQASEAAKRERAAKLDQITLDAELQQAKLQVKQTEQDLESARVKFDQVKGGTFNAGEFEDARARVNRAENNVQQAQAALRALEARAEVVKARADAGAEPGESLVAVLYDVRDLKPFAGAVRQLCGMVARQGGGELMFSGRTAMGDSIEVRARPKDHEVLVQALNTIRQAKANEPNLPGLNAADLIRKSQEERK